MSETLRLSTTLASIDLDNNHLGKGGGRSLEVALHLNTTHAPIFLHRNHLGESDNHLAEG
jgi:hypothetical protein